MKHLIRLKRAPETEYYQVNLDHWYECEAVTQPWLKSKGDYCTLYIVRLGNLTTSFGNRFIAAEKWIDENGNPVNDRTKSPETEIVDQLNSKRKPTKKS